MVNKSWEQFDNPEDFTVNEVTDASDEAENVIIGGTVEDWWAWELIEKAKARPYITGVVLSTWSIAIIVSVIKLLTTGSFLFAIPPALISVPVCIVLRYYFSSG